jgi:hypothetical protein
MLVIHMYDKVNFSCLMRNLSYILSAEIIGLNLRGWIEQRGLEG